jgi:hypothetical protein
MALPANGPNEIKIRVSAISQLFDPLDPSPMRERDIDVHTHKFLVGWARELPREAAFTIVVEAPKEETDKSEALAVGEAFANYFYSCADDEERDLRELFRIGWRSLLIGLVVLVFCLSGSQILAKRIQHTMIARVAEESLIIVGWVANWRSIEIYLYDWWPIRRRIALFRRIAAAPVVVRSIRT